ncbi:apolipoprotein N-acyltransferase [Spirochaetota bacterium]
MRRFLSFFKSINFMELAVSIKKISYRNIYETIINRKIDFVSLLLVITFYLPKVDELRLYKNLRNNSVSAWILFIIGIIAIIFYLIKCRSRILEFLKANYYILTAYLMFLSFPVYGVSIFMGFPFFGWIAFIPLYIFLRGKSLKDIYWYSFITGVLGNYLVYEWIGNFAGDKAGGYTIIVSGLMLVLTVFFAMRFLIAEFFSKKFEGVRYLVYPSVWILVSFIQSIGFLAFPWYLGYSQYAFLPFIQVSAFIGILGIEFILILFNYLISDFIYIRNQKGISFKETLKFGQGKRLMTALFVLIIIIIYGSVVLSMNNRETKRDLRVSIVQTCISPWGNWTRNKMKYLDELLSLTEQSMSENPDFIIWSESATLEYISYKYEKGRINKFLKKLLNFVEVNGKPLLTGEIGILENQERLGRGRYFNPQNNAVLINGQGEVVQSYAKINLVPFGEWVPYSRYVPAVQRLANSLGGSNFVPGDKPLLFDLYDKKFGALICYEGIFYRLCRKYKRMGADYLIDITNDGWTDKYKGHMQHFAAYIFRAIENGLWLIRAGNTGYSTIIDPYGRIKASMPILKKGYFTGDIDFSLNHDTFYAKFGDLFFYITQCFLGILMIAAVVKKIRGS